MRLVIAKYASEVYKRAEKLRYKFTDRSHTPYNKKAGQFESSIGSIEIEIGHGYLDITASEVTTSNSGHVAMRSINVTPTSEHVELLRDFLTPDDVTQYLGIMTEFVKLKYGNLDPDVWELIQQSEAISARLKKAKTNG